MTDAFNSGKPRANTVSQAFDRPRDPKRIDPLLALLAEAWKRHPDMRLGQLLVNLLAETRPNPLFNVEDDKVGERLYEFLETGQWGAPKG